MRMRFAAILGTCLGIALPLAAQSLRELPDPALTPGSAATADASEVCVAGYSRAHRDVSISTKRLVYARYGEVYIKGAAELDHLVPLELAGDNSIENLWPEPYSAEWSAKAKDALEDRLRQLVCSGRMELQTAQAGIAGNWIALYKQVFHTSVPRYRQRVILEGR